MAGERGLEALPPRCGARCGCGGGIPPSSPQIGVRAGRSVRLRAPSRGGAWRSRAALRLLLRPRPEPLRARRGGFAAPPSLPARRRRSRSGAAAVGLACAPAVGVFCSGGGRHGSASAAAPPAPASLFAEKQGGGACLPFGRLRRRRSSCPRPPLNDWGRGRAAFISRFARRCGAGCPLRRGFCPRGGDCGGGTPPLKVFFP